MSQKPVISIIAPIYNEVGNIPELYRRIREVMQKTGEPWELVMVDDGSIDGSTDLIREFHDQDSRVVPVIFARNLSATLILQLPDPVMANDESRACNSNASTSPEPVIVAS